MGSLVLPIRELLTKPELLMDQWLNLDGALPQSQILLRAQLKVRTSTFSDTFQLVFLKMYINIIFSSRSWIPKWPP